MKLLLEMRPALDGYAGIPQETRLLFRTLATLPGVELEGLLQSSNKVLPSAVPPRRTVSASEAIDRQSRVVVALQQNDGLNRIAWLGYQVQRVVAPAAMLAATALGLRTRLGLFSPRHFEDFVWRALFAKSLALADRELVTTRPHRVVRVPWSAMHAAGIVSARLGHALYPRLDTRGIDALIVETPYPGRVTGKTRLIVRYHDAIPLLMPHTIVNRRYHQASHYHALRRNVRDGAWFACVSEATRADLLSVFPEVQQRAVVIPNMVSHVFHDEASAPERVPEIVWRRRNRRLAEGGGAPVAPTDLRQGCLDYLLVVATIEPRKNHLTVLEAWERMRTQTHPQLNLLFVGSPGWEHAAILRRMAPWLERGGLHLLEDVPADELRLLYRHARATVCPSLSEGFDFAGVEAMCCGGVVAASDIAVHREVYGDAALYFSPYAPDQLQAVLTTLLGCNEEQAALRPPLVAQGARVGASYRAERLTGQWTRFLEQVVNAPLPPLAP